MIIVIACLWTIISLIWSYAFMKTYQLNGYKIDKYFKSIFCLKLSVGDKNKLIFTKRIIRFLIFYIVILFLMFYLINSFTFSVFLRLLNCFLIILLLPFIIVLLHYLLLPIELLIKKIYIICAKNKLNKKNIIKIAITGSYGKTSTKEILKTILEKEYKVCATPKSFNTEMGLTKTILGNLDDHDILITEMGARNVGDIKSLTKIVRPDYAVINSIGRQHIETFKNLKNIEDTKFELCESLPADGFAFFNGKSKSTKRLYERFKGQKFLINDKKGYAYAENIALSSEGSTFDLVIDNNLIKVKTKLLGACNIENIVLASSVAYKMGVSPKDISSAIKWLEPTPHRLEIIKNEYCTVIDDSYNSNEVGFEEALEVLSKFDGLKIVVTPGIVELGQEQSQINFKLGGKIADVADYIVIMNKENKNQLFSGAISHNFERKKIYFADTRKRQKEIINLLTQKGSVILFENDLPDNYS